MAVKQLKDYSGHNFLAKFEEEIRNLTQTSLRNSAYVCRIYGACIIDNKLCLVMKQYAKSLRAHIQEQGEITSLCRVLLVVSASGDWSVQLCRPAEGINFIFAIFAHSCL